MLPARPDRARFSSDLQSALRWRGDSRPLRGQARPHRNTAGLLRGRYRKTRRAGCGRAGPPDQTRFGRDRPSDGGRRDMGRTFPERALRATDLGKRRDPFRDFLRTVSCPASRVVLAATRTPATAHTAGRRTPMPADASDRPLILMAGTRSSGPKSSPWPRSQRYGWGA